MDLVPKVTHKVRVCQVVDGDTVKVCRARIDGTEKKEKLRLYGIDAPESSQTFGAVSTSTLNSIFQKTDNVVYLQRHGTDKYGRTLATLYTTRFPKKALDNINYQMVLYGLAWSYRFKKEESRRGAPIVPPLDTFDSAETVARLSKRGLFGDNYGPATRPSDYRKQHHIGKRSHSDTESSSSEDTAESS
jgi:endonuclease YncB( thermonuclease family)